ncbi:MAG: 30S ribosomal protein S9 [Cyanobacteria bacterium]|jgi:small subunit ribosomal protein S9|nr:30S ribosomal protein S9 [Cyanobacteriota bacterium]
MSANPYPKVGTRGTGRRKEAIACVRVIPGNGTILINGRKLDDYFGRKALHVPVMQPLVAAGVETRYNILVKTRGGGLSGQADAIRLGIARALADINKDQGRLMREEGFLTRDSRIKERKKYGRKKARKRFQFSKR